MQRTRTKPKWLATFAAALLSLAMLAAVGCGSESNVSPTPPPPPAPNSETGLVALSLSDGAIQPSYSPAINNYSATLWAEAGDFSVTASLADTNARLTINGQAAQSGVPFPVDVQEGFNTINIAVVAEDGRNFTATWLNVEVKPLTTKVYVLDGPGGVPVQDAVVTLTNATTGALVQDNIKVTRKEGYVMLGGLSAPYQYHISAKGKDTSTATFAWFDPTKETKANLYCLPYYIAGYPEDAPIITQIAFSPNYTSTTSPTWSIVPEGVHEFSGARANLYYVRVTAIAKSPITEDMGVSVDNHKPMRIALDHEAVSVYSSSFDYPIAADWGVAVPINRGGERYYQTSYSFLCPTAGARDGRHWLDIAVYDIASNRVNQRLYITLTDVQESISTGATGTDSDFYNFKPRFLSAQAHTYGTSLNFPGITPVPGYGAHCYNYLTFRLTEGTWLAIAAALQNPARRIRGFEVWRSDGDDKNFRKIDTLSFVLPFQGLFVITAGSAEYLGLDGRAEQRFRYYDYDPDLNENTTYYYKIRVWSFNKSGNNGTHDGFSLFTDVLAVKPLPAFASQLSAPAHRAVSKKIWPAFSHTTSPELVKPGVSSQYRFFLFAKRIDDVRETPFRYRARINFDADGKPTAQHVVSETLNDAGVVTSTTWGPAEFISVAADGTVTVDTDNEGFKSALDVKFPMEAGKTYEWSIYGQNGTSYQLTDTPTNSSYFYKSWPLPSGSNAENQDAFSFGSSSKYGLGSPNGLFTLTIDPNAN